MVVVLAGPLSMLSASPPAVAGPGTGYSYSQQITIDHTKVSGGSDLTNFPVLVSMTDTFLISAANGGWVQNSNGYDIIFTDSTQTTKLDHEIESYVPTTGQIQMWVRIPTLSHSTDTTIYMFYGNSSVSTSQENKTGVWDSNYKGVWHLKESGNGTAGEFKDSTSNANNATGGNGNSAHVPAQAAGQIANGQNFVRANTDWIDDRSASNIPSLTANQSVSFWYNVTSNPATNQVLFATQVDSGDGAANQIEFCSGTSLTVNADACGSSFVSIADPAANAWHLFTWTWDGTTNRLYIDGTQQTTSTSAPSASAAGEVTFGDYDAGGAGASLLNGLMDEVRISNTVRSAGWITTEYNNQNSPSTFFSIAGPSGSQNVTIGIPVAPAFTFTVANQSSACNGESNFISGAGTATAVNLGTGVDGSNYSGGQALSVAGNAGSGFTVYIAGTQATQNLRKANHNWTDVTGTYASPAVLGAGERFGYTYLDSTSSSSVTNPASAKFIALTNATTNAVMGSTSSQTGSGCVSFDAQAGATTPAGYYTATIVYNAIPTF